MDDPTRERHAAVERARDKLDEADYFLGLIRNEDGTQCMAERRRAVRHCLSAFLTAARSAAGVISRTEREIRGEKKDNWAWADEARREWPAEDRQFHQALTNLRDLSVHAGKGRPSETIEKVPVWDFPARRAHPFDGRVFVSAPPGTPPPRVGVNRFYVSIDGQDVPAIQAATRYLALVAQMVGHYAASLPQPLPTGELSS